MIRPEEQNCTGCGACKVSCPKKCITMQRNKNGFLLPVIDEEKCVDCTLCEKVCPMMSSPKMNDVGYTYAAYLNAEEDSLSTSGGMFYAFANAMLQENGHVFGAVNDGEFNLMIKKTSTLTGLCKMQGSKYYQADTQDSFCEVRSELEQGRKVLYTGTPCQIAGLKSFLKRGNCDNLLTVEIICHGAPSQIMFQDYIRWKENKSQKKIVNYVFRPKNTFWHKDFRCLISYSDGTSEVISGFKDPFYKLFMEANCFRKSCYTCPFAQKNRIADITIGDFWNIEEVDVHFGEEKRVSVVLINSDKGRLWWEKIRDMVTYKEVSWEVAAKGNSNLVSHTVKPIVYMEYADFEDKISFYDSVMKRKGNKKKQIFNELPRKLRIRIKKFF